MRDLIIAEDLREEYETAGEERYVFSEAFSGAYVRSLIERTSRAEIEKERFMQRLGTIEVKSHLQTIDERDDAEQALSQAYYLIKGESPEWSNNFGHQDALDEIDDAQRCLRAENAQLRDRIATLEAQVERMSHPVVIKNGAHGVTNLRGPLVLKHGPLCIGCQQVRDQVFAARRNPPQKEKA